MPRRALLCLIVAALLAPAPTSVASIVRTANVFQVKAGEWHLCSDERGRAFLNKFPYDSLHRWRVNAPSIKDDKDRFLAADPEGLSPALQLVKKEGDHTRWVFEVTAHVGKPPPKSACSKNRSGSYGFRFKARLARGAYKGWYLGAEAVTEAMQQGPFASRQPRLVKDPKQAIEWEYIEDRWWVD